MSTIQIRPGQGFFGRKLYLLISVVTSVPVFIVVDSFVDAIGVDQNEQVAVAITACFFAGIFTGRYLAQNWTATLQSMPFKLITFLVILTVISTIWIFVHADFPLKGRVALNILLYWIPFVVISLSLGILMKIINAVNQNQLIAAKTSAAHSQTELHLLQSQLSPHFLFNTLNNMYGLSLTRQEKIPSLLLKLSELLRYSVYNTSEIYVPLKDEMAYINNYIEFEKIRIGDRLVLTLDLENIGAAVKIAPMLLIVFVENAFKHSKNSAEEHIYIEIVLKTFGHAILFSVKNSHSEIKSEQRITDKNSGFGLASVHKRLALLYPNEHELEIEKTEIAYNVLLRLKIK